MSHPLLIDPRAVPVIAHDVHLPAVPGERLLPAALRQRFAAPPSGWVPEFPGDGRLIDRAPANASVLVPLVLRAGQLQVLLTQRTAHLADHAGQISFPGGRAEPGDADAVATALRETEEEVGLAHHHIEVIGSLPTYTTVTHFVVTPVIALVTPDFEIRPDPAEVAEVFEVPLAFLMNPAHHRRHAVDGPAGRREFYSMPWQPVTGAPDYFIWGATAAMLRNLYRFLSA